MAILAAQEKNTRDPRKIINEWLTFASTELSVVKIFPLKTVEYLLYFIWKLCLRFYIFLPCGFSIYWVFQRQSSIARCIPLRPRHFIAHKRKWTSKHQSAMVSKSELQGKGKPLCMDKR